MAICDCSTRVRATSLAWASLRYWTIFCSGVVLMYLWRYPIGACATGLCQPDEHLACVLPTQQADEGLGRPLQPLHDRLAVLDAPLAQQAADLLGERAHAVAVVADDEAAQRQALAHGVAQVPGPGDGLGRVVLGDRAA